MYKNYNYNLLTTKIKELAMANAELSKAIFKLTGLNVKYN